MERLTVNKLVGDMTMVELVYNQCFIKEGEAWHQNYDRSISCRDLARELIRYRCPDRVLSEDFYTDDDRFDDDMIDFVSYGFKSEEGLIAAFYHTLWGMADLHEKLKQYEDICSSIKQLKQISKLFLEKCEEVNRLQIELELNKRPLPYSRPEHCLDCQLLNRDDDCVLQNEKANRAAGESWEALMQGCPLQAVRENGWIPLWTNIYPETDDYILLSFENYPVPQVGRYEENEEGGNFYLGDEEDTCISQELIVNAWQPLPERYREE